jgi:hypothetical protein
MDYLMENILERTDQEFIEIYNFIRDRGRALRKDFKVQNHLKGAECVHVLERLTRFLIHADFMLCELPESRYSWKQNRHQIFDTLTTLMEVYDDERLRNITFPHESEFRAYFVLLLLDDPLSVDRLQSWSADILDDSRVQVAMTFHQHYQNKFYQPFFQDVRGPKTTYLMACLLHNTFSQIRRDGMKSLHAATTHRDKPFPIDALTDLLCFNDADETIEFCQQWQLEMVHESEPVPYLGVRLGKKDGKPGWIGMLFYLWVMS